MNPMNDREPSDDLLPIERQFLVSKGYNLQKDVFQRDICSNKPNTIGNYNGAVSTLARLLGYRDHWDRDFQKTRRSYTALLSV